MLLLAASIFFCEPVPLEMPRAEAYLATSGDGSCRAEDRYNRKDLWISQAVAGRWIDEDGRVFILSDIAIEPPSEISSASTVTRRGYAKERRLFKLDRSSPPSPSGSFLRALKILSPVEPSEECAQIDLPRGYKALRYWHGTNTSAVVCAFLPENSSCWRLATWRLAQGDDFGRSLEVFEEEFLKKEALSFNASKPYIPDASCSERELWRNDVRHSVDRYERWRVTDRPEFMVIDDLPGSNGFVEALTNELEVMHAKYSAAIPGVFDGAGHLSVLRIFGSHDEYLDALSAEGITNMNWSAAYWCRSRRELVAFLPPEGNSRLMKTVRHEFFHQYLSFASGMIEASPWINEGYAEYFEDESVDPFDFLPDVTNWADALKAVMSMDYRQFYSGNDAQRAFNYTLAHAIAYFLEHGAGKVRFNPFGRLKADYFKALVSTRDMASATLAAFGSEELFDLFVQEWLKFKEGG